jgi:hypothetical protein
LTYVNKQKPVVSTEGEIFAKKNKSKSQKFIFIPKFKHVKIGFIS